MQLAKDFKEFLQSLNASEVEYLVVGAHAFAVHVRPRFTGDLDVWIRPTADNISRLLDALRRFGFPTEQIAAADLERPDAVVQLGFAPVRIDVLSGIDGVGFQDAYLRRVQADLDGVPVAILSRADLIANKRATGRPQDLADLALLEGG